MALRRRIIREKVVQALYAHELSGNPADQQVAEVLVALKKNKQAHAFACRLFRESVEHARELDELIRSRVAHWDFDRIALLDRLILRMAICELLYFNDIPPKVSIDEAIELARLFSTERSSQFVNGVLDSVMDDLRTQGTLPKSGRGLFDGPAESARKRSKGSRGKDS